MRLNIFKRKINKNHISFPRETENSMSPSSPKTDSDSETVLIHEVSCGKSKYNSFSIEKSLHGVVTQDRSTMAEVLQTLNNSRGQLHSRYYIYDKRAFEKVIVKGETHCGFDIFSKPNGINHRSCRYVLLELMKRLKTVIAEDEFPYSVFEIFAPSLEHLDTDNLLFAKSFIQDLFPHDGCTLWGTKLKSRISDASVLTLIISIRVILSLLPGGLVTGEAYEQFVKEEEEDENIDTTSSFYTILPACLPTSSHPYFLQGYLDLVVAAWCHLASGVNIGEVLNVAAALCFQTPHYSELANTNRDIYFYKQYYVIRNNAFQRVFYAYLRNIITEGSISPKKLPISTLGQYPPVPYQPTSVEHALVVSVPKHRLPRKNASLDDLVDRIASSKATVYSSNGVLYFDEGVLLRKLCQDPYKTLLANTTEISLEYLKRFDSNNILLTKIQSSNEDSKEEELEEAYDVENAVRVSKLVMSQWFFNNWKYETSVGNLRSTFIFELENKIGQVDWLIITSDEQERGTTAFEESCVDPEMVHMEKNNNSVLPSNCHANSDIQQDKRRLSVAPIVDCNDMFVISEMEELEDSNINLPAYPLEHDQHINTKRNSFPQTPTKSTVTIKPRQQVQRSPENVQFGFLETEIYEYLNNKKRPSSLCLPNNSPTKQTPHSASLNNLSSIPNTELHRSASGRKRRHSERESSDISFNDSYNEWTGSALNETSKTGISMMKTSPRCTSLKELLGTAY